jgi:hypothetical protein
MQVSSPIAVQLNGNHLQTLVMEFAFVAITKDDPGILDLKQGTVQYVE